MNLTLDNVVGARANIEKKFDFLFDEVQKVLSKYNPCAITIKDKSVHCIGCGFGGNNPNELCCSGCKFHTKSGCIANRPLTCKTWLCGKARMVFPECAQELDNIVHRVIDLNLYVFRGDKDASIKNHIAWKDMKERC